MSLSFRPGHRIFVFNELIDMRSGFARLSMLVRDRMQQQLLEGDFFVFLGQNRKRLKAICFDGTGLILLSKRLEIGHFMRVSDFESFDITAPPNEVSGIVQRVLWSRKQKAMKPEKSIRRAE
jgi:transposase